MNVRARSWIKALGLLAGVAVLAGCGSDGTTQSSSGGGGTLATSAVNSTTIVFSGNVNPNIVRSVTLNQNNGILTLAGGTSRPSTDAGVSGATGSNGAVVTIPSREAVYFGSNPGGAVQLMTLNADGSFADCTGGCSALNNTVNPTDVLDLAVHPSSTFLYAVTAASVQTFSIASNGTLSRVSANADNSGLTTGHSLVVNSAGTLAFATESIAAGAIQIYQLLTNGVMQRVGSNTGLATPRGLIFTDTPRPNTLYVAENAVVSMWAVTSNGALTRFAALSTAAQNTAVAMSANQDFLYVTDANDTLLVVALQTVAPVGIPSSQLSVFPGANGFRRMVVSGRRVVVVTNNSPGLETYRISAGSGAITREARFDSTSTHRPAGAFIREPGT